MRTCEHMGITEVAACNLGRCHTCAANQCLRLMLKHQRWRLFTSQTEGNKTCLQPLTDAFGVRESAHACVRACVCVCVCVWPCICLCVRVSLCVGATKLIMPGEAWIGHPSVPACTTPAARRSRARRKVQTKQTGKLNICAITAPSMELQVCYLDQHSVKGPGVAAAYRVPPAWKI